MCASHRAGQENSGKVRGSGSEGFVCSSLILVSPADGVCKARAADEQQMSPLALGGKKGAMICVSFYSYMFQILKKKVTVPRTVLRI